MTYCVAIRLDAGLVFLSDSRTNAGVDQVNTFRKMTVFEKPGDRLMVMMTAGNLAVGQSVRQLLAEGQGADGPSLWNAATMYEAATVVGAALRTVHERDGAALKGFGIDFNVSIIFGGQIGRERCRLFSIYAAGNFIEALEENCYFQIGEAKYGKPILDRVVSPRTSLDEAAKCALISMDSTLRSNISVGLPLDLLVYEGGSLRVTRFAHIDEDNRYFQMIRGNWGQRLRQVFGEIPNPSWESAADHLLQAGEVSIAEQASVEPVRVAAPAAGAPAAKPIQTLADGPATAQN